MEEFKCLEALTNYSNGNANANANAKALVFPHSLQILASGHLRNSLQAPNQEPAGGLRNASNLGNMNKDNFGEDTSTGANQQYQGRPLELNLWDLINYS